MTITLTDLSHINRTGFKGTGAIDWATSQELDIGNDDNKAYLQKSGLLIARLAPTEFWVLDNMQTESKVLQKLQSSWSYETGDHGNCWPVPRFDSHIWLQITGDQCPEMLAKLCGVDFRPYKFEDLHIAQTSIARTSGIVIRQDMDGLLAFHLFCDRTQERYIKTCLENAIAEFNVSEPHAPE